MLNKKLLNLFQTIKLISKNFYKFINFKEVEEKSSHYGLYKLGFTCATRVKTKRYNNVN